MLFLLMCLGGLLGNLIIIMVTTIDQKLCIPMYFFLGNLSILDMCYISITMLNAFVHSLTDIRGVSGTGWAVKMFLVILCTSVEVLFLTVMGQDCYVAVCQPILYSLIMNPQFCVQLTVFPTYWPCHCISHIVKTFQLFFCFSDAIPQFCDVPSLLRLSCSDTFNNKLLILLSTLIINSGCFTFMIVSYVHVFSTMLKFTIKEKRGKTFSTCVPHIIVLSVFLCSGACVYLRPPVITEVVQDMTLSELYTIVPSFLNPIIYSLRNKQIKESMRKIMLKKFYAPKL